MSSMYHLLGGVCHWRFTWGWHLDKPATGSTLEVAERMIDMITPLLYGESEKDFHKKENVFMKSQGLS